MLPVCSCFFIVSSSQEEKSLVQCQVVYLYASDWLKTMKLLWLLYEASSIVCCQRWGKGAHKSLFCFILLFLFIAHGFSVIVWLFHSSLKWEPSKQWSMSGNCWRGWREPVWYKGTARAWCASPGIIPFECYVDNFILIHWSKGPCTLVVWGLCDAEESKTLEHCS